jgi:FMN-dependent NADH-azoreductase
MKILRIDSSVRIQNSKTRMLTDYFLELLKDQNEYSLKSRDVGINPPKFPTDQFIKANYTPQMNRTQEMKNVLTSSDTLIDELIDADKIVLASPMYNFSISATLKAYIDNIVRVGKTFALDENGAMKGLLGGKKVLIITSRGAMSYKKGEVLQPFDFQENYLTALLNFLGITDITFINTEAQDFGTEELKNSNFEHSKNQLSELAKVW